LLLLDAHLIDLYGPAAHQKTPLEDPFWRQSALERDGCGKKGAIWLLTDGRGFA
jgi:hypothetical protein